MALRVLCVTRSIFVTVVWRRQLRHGGHINVPQEWNGGHVIVTPQWVELTHFLCYAKHKIDASKLWSSQLWTQFKQLRIQAWKSQDFNGLWTRDLVITNSAMKPLTLWAGHLWVLMSPWRMDVKWYTKCFIYWTADFEICLFQNPQFNIWNISYITWHKIDANDTDIRAWATCGDNQNEDVDALILSDSTDPIQQDEPVYILFLFFQLKEKPSERCW